MTHIEFLGPPGAGKSTIYSQLIASDRFYGGTEDDAVQRIFLERTGVKYRIPCRVMPSGVRRFFLHTFMQDRYKYSALKDFICDYPNFVSALSIAMGSVKYEPETVFSYCRRSAEEYQLGISTVSPNEILCLDESFAQRALTILWRRPDESFSLNEYFDSVPIPDLVVHIDAPADLCLERQLERGGAQIKAKGCETVDSKTVQEKNREHCLNIRNHLANKTSVVTVENTETVEKAVEKIRSNSWEI